MRGLEGFSKFGAFLFPDPSIPLGRDSAPKGKWKEENLKQEQTEKAEE
jgi:hypothetical protein